jgi:two-component system, chemotaxis family, chemotaxis protein CheY
MRVLIVEDEYVSRTKLKAILSGVGDCDAVPSGEVGILMFNRAYADRVPYDLVCLDIMMPGMNGHEFLKKVGAIEKLKGITNGDGVKVVMTTSIDGPNNIELAKKIGCAAYLVKPIKRKTLLAKVAELGFDVVESA